MFNFPGCTVTSNFKGLPGYKVFNMIQRSTVLPTTTLRIIAGLQLAAEASQGEFVSFFCHVWCVCWVRFFFYVNVEGRSLSLTKPQEVSSIW